MKDFAIAGKDIKAEKDASELPKMEFLADKLKSTGNKDEILKGKDVKASEVSDTKTEWAAVSQLKHTETKEKPKEGGPTSSRISFSADQLKATGLKDIAIAGKDIKTEKDDMGDSKVEFSADTLKSTGNKDEILKGKDVKASSVTETKTEWAAVGQLKPTETKEKPKEGGAKARRATFSPDQLKATGLKDIAIAGKDIKAEKDDMDDSKVEWTSADKLKSTGNKDQILKGKDVKASEVSETKTEWTAVSQLKHTETKEKPKEGGAKARRATFHPDQLKATGLKDVVLAGEDVKTDNVKPMGQTWMPASELKLTGNKDAILSGVDIKQEPGAATSESHSS